MSGNRYSRVGAHLRKADLRRDVDFALLALEDANAAVASTTDLTAVEDQDLGDSALKFSSDLKCFFRLSKTDSTPLKEAVVLATKSGGGRWLRSFGVSLTWSTRDSWYLDTTSGSDLADGTSGTPLKSFEELCRRWRSDPDPFTTDVVVYVTGDVTEWVKLVLPKDKLNGHTIHVKSTAPKTVHATGTFSATAAFSYTGAGSAQTVTSVNLTSGNWTTHRGRKIRITSGPRAGCWAFIDKDLGANVARTNPFLAPAALFEMPDAWTVASTVPQAGDAFEVISDPEITVHPMVDISTSGGSTPSRFDLQFEGFRFTSGASYDIGHIYRSGSVCFIGCDVAGAGLEGVGSLWFLGSRATGDFNLYESPFIIFYASYIDGNGAAYIGGWDWTARVSIGADTLISGAAHVASMGPLNLHRICIVDNQAGFATFEPFSKIGLTNRLYGSDNAAAIIQMDHPSVDGLVVATLSPMTAWFTVTSSVPVVDFGNGVTKGWNQLPFASNATAADSHSSILNGY